MYQSLSFNQLAEEIVRQKDLKEDYVAMTSDLRVSDDLVTMDIGSNRVYVNDHCHGQIGNTLGIPASFYSKMSSRHPDLLSEVINGLFTREPRERMVRCLDGKARAFLSNRYARLDNHDFMEVVVDAIAKNPECGGLEPASCDINEQFVHMKLLFPRLKADIKEGDTVQYGLYVRNSEVGAGALHVRPFLNRLVCSNGMIVASEMGGLRATHLGSRIQIAEDGVRHVYSEETLRAETRATWSKVKDIIDNVASKSVFDAAVNSLKESTERKIEGDVTKVVEKMAEMKVFNETDTGSVLTYLVNGGDLSQYGLAQAVTRYSQDVESYEKATDLEEAGGKIIAFNSRDWSRLIKSAA